jgi:hypothetical protein
LAKFPVYFPVTKEFVAETGSTLTASTTTNNQPSVIIVEVIGYGGDTGAPAQPQDDKQHKTENDKNYDLNSAFKLLGNGALTQEQQKNLTDEERTKLRQLERSNAL